jgi:excisionase family DNA binding protein
MTGQRVTTKEAAEALGISVEAVRKRIERGQLGHERVDGRVYVYLDDDQIESGPDVEVESTAPISEMQARIELLERQLDQANERDRENRRLLAAALERIPPQLEAPESPPAAQESAVPRSGTESPHTAREQPFTEEEEQQRPWWQRWFQSR